MADMVRRVPDEVFRRGAAGPGAAQGDVGDGVGQPAAPEPAGQPQREGVEPRLLVLMLVLAMVAGFFGGRMLLIRLDTGEATPLASETPVATVAPSADDDAYTPYAGSVKVVEADGAKGECAQGIATEVAAALVDSSDTSIWRCRGDGVGETAKFTFDSPVNLAAIRVVNGNTVWTDRYSAERRITAIRWTFDDGSFFDQGMAPNDRALQEVRFPETRTTEIKLEILAATDPGDDSSLSDAVSISELQFLGPA